MQSLCAQSTLAGVRLEAGRSVFCGPAEHHCSGTVWQGTDLTQTQRLMVVHWRSSRGEGGVESDLWPPGCCCQSLGRRMNCLSPREDELPKGHQRGCPGSGMHGREVQGEETGLQLQMRGSSSPLGLHPILLQGPAFCPEAGSPAPRPLLRQVYSADGNSSSSLAPMARATGSSTSPTGVAGTPMGTSSCRLGQQPIQVRKAQGWHEAEVSRGAPRTPLPQMPLICLISPLPHLHSSPGIRQLWLLPVLYQHICRATVVSQGLALT